MDEIRITGPQGDHVVLGTRLTTVGIDYRTIGFEEWEWGWTLTHLPTGARIIRCASEAEARELAALLDPVLPADNQQWGVLPTTRQMRRALAVLNRWWEAHDQPAQRYIPSLEGR
jgi:hypothetical protein